MKSRPSLAILQLHLLALFATGIAMSSWVWTNSTIQTWKRFIARLTNKQTEEAPVKLKKYKVIAQAFAKRKMLNSNGRLSISIHSTHQDPVGLNFELNSMASGNLSSTWAAALPKLVTRRGALVGVTNSNSSQRRNSMDSEISYSVRRVSVESRRHSLDSAVSVQVAELTKTVRKARPSHRVRTRRRRRSRYVGSRRGSSTSQESQIDAQILSALAIGGVVDIPPVTSLVHNQNRRQATAGLDNSLDILAEKLFGNLQGPLELSQESEGSSDEEVTQVRETLISGRVNTNSGYTDEEKAVEEEEDVISDDDDVSQPLTKNYKNKYDPEICISKASSKGNRKSINDYEDNKKNKKYENDGRNSKLSIKSDFSRTSGKTPDCESEKRSSRRDFKREKTIYPSCSDLENCTDDAKWIQSEGEGKDSFKKINVGVATDCSLSPEQLHYTYQSASAVSVGGHPQHGREIGTQTNVSFNNKDRSASASSKPKRKKSIASRQKLSSTDSSLK